LTNSGSREITEESTGKSATTIKEFDMKDIDLKDFAALILEAEINEDLAVLEQELNVPLSPELEALKEELLD